MTLFLDPTGLPIKFFIQRDIKPETHAELTKTITELGGKVEEKVPRQGYILTAPGTSEGERLRQCWVTPDRPERFAVPYTYVDACKISNTVIKQHFVENGQPILFYLHPSIDSIGARAALIQRITHSGGDPTATPQKAKVVLADPDTDIFQHLCKIYQGVPNKHVESYLWVKHCIDADEVNYTPLTFKNPGGRRAGEERTAFTDDDEKHLCEWIALQIPFKETGGRTGNKLYQKLCAMEGLPGYVNWPSRHTWQSWRERYKKNAVRLDGMISGIVQERSISSGETGQVNYIRKPESKPRKTRKRSSKGGEGEMIQDSPSATEEEEMRRIATMMALQSGQPPIPWLIPMGGQIPGMPPPPSEGSSHMQQPPPPAQPAEEEDDEGPEWQVRIGNAPPPAWGKRKADEDLEGEAAKRARAIINASGSQPSMNVPGTMNHQPLSQETLEQLSLSVMNSTNVAHMLETEFRVIADTFRFTLDEVKEYYNKCGDVPKTRNRFRRMREVLNNLADD